ncbi:hypothetical protein [Litchfieldia alkalitelluris]|uniref:phytoene desaturase family protein n=1 Tax=Litchfieldia alkalitelluris TaxID=304268 RepID=UPI0015942AD7
MYDVLSNYFHDDRLLLSFTFQSKYLGMSPWKCPGAFSILSFMEYEYGIFHPIGGLNKLTEALGKAVIDNGGEIHLNTGVISKLILEGKEVRGVELESGDKVMADEVVMNADFAYGISRLVGEKHRKKYTNVKLEEKDYSCSTFMIYAGVDKEVPMGHHTILFAETIKEMWRRLPKRRHCQMTLLFMFRMRCFGPHIGTTREKSPLYPCTSS